MKWVWSFRIPQWYILFASSIFVIIAMMSGFLPVFSDTNATNKLQPIYNGNSAEPKVALTCNVFWGEEFLPDMLDTLDKYQVKITFFVGGSWAKRYPDLLKEIVNRGHEIGNHTYSHPHPNRLSKEQNKEQITKAEVLMYETTGVKTNLYAPPYGEFNDTVLQAAQELGYSTIMWSIDTVDWKRPSPEVISNRIFKKLHNGAIILMHPTDPTAKALPGIIEKMQSQGYQLVKVSEMIK